MSKLIEGENLNITLMGIEVVQKPLKEFPMETNRDSYDFKVEQMIQMLNDCYNKTKDEIKGMFTVEEVHLILATFNGFLYSPNDSDKNTLIRCIEGVIFYEGLHHMYNTDEKELLRKLNDLTEFQSFCVIRQAFEFLYSKDKWDKKMKEIFGL